MNEDDEKAKLKWSGEYDPKDQVQLLDLFQTLKKGPTKSK